MQQELLGVFAELCIYTESPRVTYPSIQFFFSHSLCREIQSPIVPPIIYREMLLSVKFANTNLQHSSDLVPGKAQEDVQMHSKQGMSHWRYRNIHFLIILERFIIYFYFICSIFIYIVIMR